MIESCECALELQNITVRFDDNTANDSVSLTVNKNEVFALVGENGAGKTTLMNVLYGLVSPESGSIRINGKPVKINSPKDAISAKLGMVHQHFMLVPSFTVAQNIALGQEPRRFGVLFDNKKATEKTRELSAEYGLDVDPNAKVCDLSIGMQQRVEILKTLSRGSDILILDEPTAVLTPGETEELFSVIRKMVNEKNKTVIIITHKLYEVMAISDRVGVMRHGKLIGVERTANTDENALASMMVGHSTLFSDLGALPRPNTHRPPAIDVRELTVSDDRGLLAVNSASLCVYPGEILGIAGVSGNGQTELAEAITGLRPIISGEVYINGIRINGMTPGDIRALKLSHIPEDRQATGLSTEASAADNLIAGSHKDKRFKKRFALINRKSVNEYAANVYNEFDVRGSGINAPASSFSGGNMQKLVIGREFSFPDKSTAVISQPTRGVDIGATEFIHKEIIKKRNSGMAILLISADLDELMRLSDRIVAVYEGKLVAEFDAKTAKKEDIGRAMLGEDINSREAQ